MDNDIPLNADAAAADEVAAAEAELKAAQERLAAAKARLAAEQGEVPAAEGQEGAEPESAAEPVEPQAEAAQDAPAEPVAAAPEAASSAAAAPEPAPEPAPGAPVPPPPAEPYVYAPPTTPPQTPPGAAQPAGAPGAAWNAQPYYQTPNPGASAPGGYGQTPHAGPGAVPPAQPNPAYQQPYYQQPYQPVVASKDHVAAGLLAIFLGMFGIHKFYLGYNTAGFIMLAVTVVGGIFTFWLAGIAAWVMWVIAIVEGILYLTKSQTEFEQIYVLNKKEWF